MRICLFFLAATLMAQSVLFPGPGMTHAAAVQTLARTFNGSSDSLQSAATIDLTSTKIVSLSFWMYWDTFGSNDLLAFESSANYNSNSGAFIVDPNDTSFGSFAFNVHGLATALACRFTRPSGATWHHYLLQWDITTAAVGNTCAAYVDGSSQSVTIGTTMTPSQTFGNFTLNVMSRNAASLFGAGRMSDIAIWKSTLTSGNATSLAACADPSTIDAGNLLFYWPIKQVSPETPNVGAVNLTVNGTTNSNGNCVR